MKLQLKNISKSYHQGLDKIQILKDLNLEVNEQETLAIIGKSGSGKSTLLSILAGLADFEEGEYLFENVPRHKMNETEWSTFRAHNIGIVFQQFHLISTLTALENVMLPLKVLKKESLKEAKEILEHVGLSHRLNHFPHQLSGGECQRVAIARALITKPSLILADEPSGNLDYETGIVVMNLLFDLSLNYKSSLILVTHDEELSKRANRCVRLNQGKLHS
jgi:putative ABC transport system ATP-binding protein